MSWVVEGRSPRRTAAFLAAAFVVIASGGSIEAGTAKGAFGDDFGLAPAAGPALPGPHSFWAGACQIGTAPPLGAAIPGGIGSRPDPITVLSPLAGRYVNPVGPYDAPPLQRPAPSEPWNCIDTGTPAQGMPAWVDTPLGGPVDGGPVAFAPSWRLPAAPAAGAHPDGSATFTYAREPGAVGINGTPDNIVVDLPAGFIGNPTVVPKCSAEQFAQSPTQCPPQSQVGIVSILLRNPLSGGLNGQLYPVYNLEARSGKTAEFGIPDVTGATTTRIVARARTNGDFGVTTLVPQIPGALDLYTQTVTLWGVPWAASHDLWRVRPGVFKSSSTDPVIPPSGVAPENRAPYHPTWGPIRPLVSNPTECSGSTLNTSLATDSYQNPGAFTPDGDPALTDPDWKVFHSGAPAVTECDEPPFEPDIELAPTSTKADSATGLNVELDLPQNDIPPQAIPGSPNLAHDPSEANGAPAYWRSEEGRGSAQLDKAVVTLPEGVTVNPSGATGLAGCSDVQMGLTELADPLLGTASTFSNVDPLDGVGNDCPDGSKIGSIQVQTPVLDETLHGDVILGNPRPGDVAKGSPQSDLTFRLFLVLRNKERGLIAKIYGSAVASRTTGRLTAMFDKNPRVPLGHMSLQFKGGPRGQLAMPQSCGAPAWSTTLTPWTAEHGAGGTAVPDGGTFTVDGDCSSSFSPRLRAGMSTSRGRANGQFSFSLSRNDGEQWFKGITAELPTGLLASIKSVPLCTNAQANAGNCPASSRIGTVDAGAGSGMPFFLERKGDAYLTEGYKGAPYGLAVEVPVEAGPFRGEFALTPIVVRQALHVDRTDASVTVISDPVPQIWHGIPLRARQITVNTDRPEFMLNPSSCEAKQVKANVSSVAGATASPVERFQATGCAGLPFKPKLSLRLTGKRQTTTGKHPGVRAQVNQAGVGEAGIRRAEVRLPKSLALDPDNAQALCEFADGIKPDLENHCPKGSIVGRARAVSPLLKKPLSGDVYFVKNIKISSTGNPIRTLPMIIVALRGEVAVNLRGVSSTTKAGLLVNTFDNVPDAPISQFNLNVKGGNTGILTVTRTARSKINVCRGRHVAEALMDGQNGRRFDRDIKVKMPCKKKSRKSSAGKRARRG